ncbi:MipA/OmpV family protein [Loktanella agnita]|uniref:MipA/OmpV family protein n=1 Tax=Loktanella agnita TaxID=287097 RepID=UPI0039898D04
MRTVTPAESIASDFDSFDAQSGWLSAGIKAEASYQFNDDWGVTGTLRYDQLLGDTAESPITQSEDQVSASFVVTRKVTI